MASAKLNLQDRKDLEKYTRFLALKSVQVIVQSRLGEKVRTKSKPHSSGADWFNLSIKDLPEVMSECKKAFSDQIPSSGVGMCVEISLKTVDGDAMVLETWCLELTEQPSESSVRVRYTVYNRMSLLLKSLIAVTRVTPAYKLSSCQGPDSFVICYRLFMGETQWSALGDCYERVRVGRVDTPVGTLAMSVAYRTQLTISPQRVIATRDSPFMVKSDHFDGSPKWTRPVMVTGYQLAAAVTQTEQKTSVVDEIAAAAEDCPLRTSQCPSNGIHNGSLDRKAHRMSKGRDCCNGPNSAKDKQVSFSEMKKVGAFAPAAADFRRTTDTRLPDSFSDEYLIPDAPFSSLLQPAATALILGNCNHVVNNNFVLNADDKNSVNSFCTSNGHHNNTTTWEEDRETEDEHKSNGSEPEDFVLVELKPPFAGSEGTATANATTADLGIFYRECQSAPPLASFSDQPSLADQVDELGFQLAAFETNQHEFDEFVDYLCHAESMSK